MALALVQTAPLYQNGSLQTGGATFGGACAIGNLIVVIFGQGISGGPPPPPSSTVTDGNNTYTQLRNDGSASAFGSQLYLQIWYAKNVSNTALAIAADAGAGGYGISELTAFEVSGQDPTTPIDSVGDTANNASAPLTTLSVTFSTTAANTMVVGAAQTSGAFATSWTPGSGYTTLSTTSAGPPAGTFYQLESSAGSVSPNYSLSPLDYALLSAFAIKGASSGTARAMAAAIVGAASVSPTTKVARAVAYSIGARAAFGDALAVARAMHDPMLGTATLIENKSVSRAMTSAMHARTALVAAAAASRSLADAISGQTTVHAPLGATRALADAIEGQATLHVPLSAARSLASSIVGRATLTEALAIARHMAASLLGQSTLSDAAVVARALVDAVVGRAALSFALAESTPQIALAVAIVGQASLATQMVVLRGLFARILGEAGLAASTVIARGLTADIIARAIFNATLFGTGGAESLRATDSPGLSLSLSDRAQVSLDRTDAPQIGTTTGSTPKG